MVKSILWLSDNIKKFIALSDKIGFEELIKLLAENNVKTLNRFKTILDNLIVKNNL